MCKVSVVTIVRNDCVNIGRTMISVLTQSLKDFEYIVKDGLSDDGTQETIINVCTMYPDKRIKYINRKDSGIYDAMNQGVTYCQGKWVIFINSGDMFADKDVLKDIFDRLNKNVDVLFGDAIVRDESGDAIWKADISKIRKKMPFCHQSCFIKRELLLQFPYDTSYKIAADYNNILDIYAKNKKFYDVGRVISVFELNGVSSTKYVDRCKERNLVIQRHGYQRGSKLVGVLELMIQYIKGAVEKIVPKKFLINLKRWYKKRIKKYKTVDKGY